MNGVKVKVILLIASFAFLFSLNQTLTTIAHAEDDVPHVKVPIEQGFKKMDMTEFQDVDGGQDAHSDIVITCQLPSGKVLQKTDKGFDKCVARANSKKKKPLKPKRQDQGL